VKIPALLLSALLCLTAAGPLAAETRYVTDEFKITLRSGESSGHRIIKMLPTGEALTVLSTSRETGYSRVRTQDGKTGYVLTRQLETQPVARDRLAAMEQRLRELEAAPSELRSRLNDLLKEHEALRIEHEQLQEAKRSVDTEFATLQRTSANAVRISNERKELRKQVAAITREVEELKQQNRELQNSSARRWFLIGGGVLAGGILLGLILPNLRVRRKRDSWGSL
jgi:SH3 domain protein